MKEIQDPEENYTTGYVSLFRSFTNWEWFTVPNMVTVFIYCLLKANFKDKSWRGINVKRGSFITSIDSIAKDTNLTKQQVRTCLKKLEKTQEIVKQSNTRNTQITICKYNSYQKNLNSANTPPNTPITNEQHTNNKPITTTNNYNNYNKENKVIKEETKEDERHFSIIDLANKYKSNDRIINAVLNNGLKLASNKDDLLSKVDDFILHLETTGETTKQIKDFNSHFLNWIKIKKNHEPKDFSNETLQERAARLMKEEMNR